MTDLVASTFATHHPNCADVQVLLNILRMVDERQLVLNTANEEARHHHQENPKGTPKLSWGNSFDRAPLGPK